MITVVFVKNPFEPTKDREVHTFLYKEGLTVADYVRQCGHELQMKDVIMAKNAHTFQGDKPVNDGDFIVFSPVVAKGGGKNPLLIVATVALAVVSGGVGGLVATGHWGMAALAGASGWAAIGGYLAAAATMFIGGQLIQRAFGTVTPKIGTNRENPTYSWEDIQTTSGQNNPLPVTYGLVRSGGQTIGKYLYSNEDKQYLNWLVSAGRGEVEITDVRLNDNPVSNYKNVEVHIRKGANNQDVIPNFNDTVSTKSLNYEVLENEYRTDIVTGNATQGIIVYVECSAGLYYAEDDGKLSNAWVDIEIDYAKTGTTAWNSIGNYRVTDKKSGAVRRQFRIDNLPEGEYQVRMKVRGRSHAVDNTRASTRIYWTAVAGVVYDDFAYPGVALIGIKALATDQLSGSPTLKFMKERKEVYVWNSHTNKYETKPANNPAWAAYDMIHQAERIKDARDGSTVYIVGGAKAELMMYDRFAEWAEYCNTFKLKINIEINQTGEMLEVVNKYISAVGRGMVIPFGTRFGPVWDGLKDPVQMFGMGNIISGTFQEDFLQTSDRANAVEVTFTNKQKGYQQDIVKVYGPTFDTDEYDNTTQISYPGIDNMEQAYREGMFQLFCNQKMVRTVSFEADIDAIACTIGDVVIVSHDVPEWGTSGSIEAVAESVVTLNAPIRNYDAAERYVFAYRASKTDVRYEVSCTVQEVTDTHTVIRLSSLPEQPPAVGDIFDIAKAKTTSKKFVIRSISRAQELTRKIEALEYDASVFNEDYDIPTIQYSDADVTTAQNVTDVVAAQYYWINGDGTKESKVSLSWKNTSPYSKFIVSLSSDDGTTWEIVREATSASVDIPVTYGKTYTARIVTIYGITASSGVQLAITLVINIAPPSPDNHSALYVIAPPSEITTTGLELWIGVTTDAPNVSRHDIYLSADGQEYNLIGSTPGKAHTGTLAKAITATDKKIIVTSSDLVTGGSRLIDKVVCLGDEFVIYDKVTRSGEQWTLEGCIRGAYGTKAVGHAKDVTAVLVDNRLLEAAMKQEYAGSTLLFKALPIPLTGTSGLTLNDVPAVSFKLEKYYIPPVMGLITAVKYAHGEDKVSKYDILVSWDPPAISSYVCGDVWYKWKTTGDYEAEWLFGGSGLQNVIIPQAVVGATYKIAVTTRDKWNNTNGIAAAPSRETLVAMKSDKPTHPAGFTITITDAVRATWDEVTNTDIAFYEIRTDENAGVAAGLLVRTNDIQATLPLTQRSGTVYLFAKSAFGEYSTPATVSYNKEIPKAPTNVQARSLFGGLSITFKAIPADCTGAHVYIDDTVYPVQSSAFSLVLPPGVYRYKVAYVDIFGEGTLSGEALATVKAEISEDMINKETLGLDEIDKNIAKLEKEVGIVKTDVSGVQSKLTETATGLQQSITDMGNNVQSQLTQFSNSIDLRITEALNGLDGDGLITRINLSTSGVRIDGKLLHVTGQALFEDNIITKNMLRAKSVSADKLQVDTLDAISARIGTLRTATSGARTEIKDNLIEVYDADNELRVRIGGPW